MPFPAPLTRGPGWLRDWLNGLRKAALDNTPLAGEGVEISPLEGGVVIDARGSQERTTTHPFQLFDASTEADGVRVRVVRGTVSDVLPTGMVADDDPQFIISSVESGSVHLVIPTTDWGTIGTITVENAAALPTDTFDWATGAGTTYAQIGTITVADGAAAVTMQSITGNISFVMVGDVPGWRMV